MQHDVSALQQGLLCTEKVIEVKKPVLKASILRKRPDSSRDNVENVSNGNVVNGNVSKKLKAERKVLSSKLPLQPANESFEYSSSQESKDTKTSSSVPSQPSNEDDYSSPTDILENYDKVSYSLLSSTSFYEVVPVEDDDDWVDDVEDLRNFGFDLQKHNRLLKRREMTYRPKPNYIRWQPFITPKVRMVLLVWLAEVCDEFQLQRETWHIAVNCVDRFLSCMPKIARSKLQLIGVAALLLSCKIEEYSWPSVNIMEQLADGACSRDQIVLMEKLMLQKIGWLLLPVTPFIFLRLYLLLYLKSLRNSNHATVESSNNGEKEKEPQKAETQKGLEAIEGFPKKEFVKMMQIVDIAMMDYASLAYAPSLIAACVLHLVYIPDESVIFNLTDYTVDQMRECTEWLRPFMEVPLPRSYFLPEELLPSNFHFLQVSNPPVKEFLESYL